MTSLSEVMPPKMKNKAKTNPCNPGAWMGAPSSVTGEGSVLLEMPGVTAIFSLPARPGFMRCALVVVVGVALGRRRLQ
jgi:hypothetical protein